GVLMVESEASELPESVMLEAVMFGWKGFQPVIDAIIDLAEKAAKEPWDIPGEDEGKKELAKKLQDGFGKDFAAAYDLTVKQERQTRLAEIRAAAVEKLAVEGEIEASVIDGLCKQVESDIVRGGLIKTGKRIDGRDTKTVRPIV